MELEWHQFSSSLLKSPGLFSVFWLILIMLVFLFPSPAVPVPILKLLYWAYQLQLLSRSLSCSKFFSFLARSWYLYFFAFFEYNPVVYRNGKVHYSAGSLFCRLSLSLAEIRWCVCISKSQRILCVSFSRTDSRLCIYHLFIMSNFDFFDQFHRPIVSSLIPFWHKLTAFAYYVNDCFVSVTTQSISSILLHLDCSCFDIVCPYGVVLCCSQKRFSFSVKVSFSWLCPNFLVWDFPCLSLEISKQLFSLPFLIIFAVDVCVVCIFSGRCNQYSSVFSNVIFESLYQRFDDIFNLGESSPIFFPWHLQSVNVISGM